MNAEETTDSVISLHGDAFPSEPRWIQSDADTLNPLSERVLKTLILVVCGWSLIEAPLELRVSEADAAVLALLVSKLVVVGTGLAAVANVRFARNTFVFLCGVSVLAITPALRMEFDQSLAIAMFSTVECLSKAACVVAFGFASLREKRSRRQ